LLWVSGWDFLIIWLPYSTGGGGIRPLPWEINLIPQITQVTYLKDYQLRLQFNDGTVREVDLYNKLFGEEFKPLKNLHFFRQVRLNPETHTIEWPNGAYFSPGYLYEIGREVKETA
jgi:Protein of unknown function (DUF2442)